MPPKRPQAFQRAVQKLRCAGAVANLARGWQGWASQHSQKQDAVPSGWTPSSLDHCLRQEGQSAAKLADGPAEAERACGSLELVSAIRSKMEAAPEDSRTYLGSESPTRRRHMRALQEGGGGGVIQERKLMLQEKNLGSRSSSVDTEDSGLGEENGLSDNGEPKPEPEVTHTKKHTNRPKVRRRRRGR
ncbi:unnamed protein product [Tetraodon nigroviridis]|uniref:(spotted green pufferfish) hypothetical protein n=1 Tax=Tetraodon nigroviridis TaxID=99883 RepID=Q4T5H2_TETNG|nr:unnamed protein product [Tetraodon nigroviridis]